MSDKKQLMGERGGSGLHFRICHHREAMGTGVGNGWKHTPLLSGGRDARVGVLSWLLFSQSGTPAQGRVLVLPTSVT